MGLVVLLAWALGVCFLIGLSFTFVGVRMAQHRVHALSDVLSGCGLAMTGIGGAGLLFILTNWPPQ